MKVCGFTIIRNAIKYDYPVVEAIQSVLPLCDKFIVLIGNSEDETEALIKGIISDKIEIHYSVWDDTLREGGKVLAVETNKAFDLIDQTFDWAIYIQSDEAIHERYHEAIKQSLLNYKSNDKVNGLLLKYLHFYGSYDYVGTSRKWYRNEIRIIKNDKRIRSFRDAQGFRINDRKLNVVPVEAFVYHYGWVKDPLIQARKHKDFNKLWHDDAYVASIAKEIYNYSDIDALALFQESHPEVMKQRIEKKNWDFDGSKITQRAGIKDKFLYWFENATGIRLFEYRNYTIVKP
ncbi:MAG: glycosyltransferase family 2 protein [Saprospiraceae bacterium]|uniref:glycosyltransferase family 2 protein n=1 Tax=Candidatus Brachybacter algidus TaxID=2982024 RepID=UPI001D3567AF|nr:glycosyltransferase family 2 protein [Candidatus Brachybacter algidus]MBK6448365.1 glycosyltransferase family 2 protein [Candidatus Brachybacter algidus]MBK8749614.1 glycosyltransferase family 2 protein [Candidatus Brachybacter algidus]